MTEATNKQIATLMTYSLRYGCAKSPAIIEDITKLIIEHKSILTKDDKSTFKNIATKALEGMSLLNRDDDKPSKLLRQFIRDL